MLNSILRRLGTITLIAGALLLSGVATPRAQTLNDSGLKLTQVASGLIFPTTMAFIGSNDILVLQKNDGRVRRVTNGVVQAGQVLDLNVDTDSERGLLGIALHPNFATNSLVYLYYTDNNSIGDSSGSGSVAHRVARYTWNGSALTHAQTILSLPATPGPNHDGGIILFAPDGKLYIVIGDLNRDGQLQNFPAGSAPDDTSVILRLNDDGSVPNDNPFVAQGGNLAKYFAYGVRNSFGMAFDPLTNQLWDTENGPNVNDEINLVNPGFNSGWETIMGPAQGGETLFVVPGSQYADPKFTWTTTIGVTAVAFLNTTKLGPLYQNDMVVGDTNNGRLYRFKLNSARDGFVFQNPVLNDLVANNNSEAAELVLGNGFGIISDLKIGPDGLLYLVSLTQGKIFSIERKLTVNCPTDSLQAAIDNVIPGDTITVSGTCNENVLVPNDKQRIAIDGSGAGAGTRATINGGSSSPVLTVRGKGITIQNFKIVGGNGGITVNRGSNAVLNSNVIQNSAGHGVHVDQLAFAALTNNMIANNSAGAGVMVSESATARIGFNLDSDTTAGANTIQNNSVGIVVANRASARIVGNTISSNSGDGVQILRDAQADLASNTMANNGGDAIELGENSMLQLGEDAGNSIFEAANSGGGNTGFGVKCTTGGIADGRRGSLTGNLGATNFDGTCIDDLS